MFRRIVLHHVRVEEVKLLVIDLINSPQHEFLSVVIHVFLVNSNRKRTINEYWTIVIVSISAREGFSVGFLTIVQMVWRIDVNPVVFLGPTDGINLLVAFKVMRHHNKSIYNSILSFNLTNKHESISLQTLNNSVFSASRPSRTLADYGD